jgi:paraquat-inducible protein B
MILNMNKPVAAPPPSAPGNAHTVFRRRPSAIWIVPLLALLVGLSMLVHAWLSAGPEITVSFQSATGLEAGKTPVKYKDVVVGVVKTIELSPDQSNVLVTIDLDKHAKNFNLTDSRYWVVRPRVGTGGISGIDTLFSGAYIGVDVGRASTTQDHFTGLETPPSVINGTPGTAFNLHAADLGSLDIGSPVYYRHIQVGQLTSYHLDPNGRGVSLQTFIHAPYDHFVSGATRFWNASGLDLSLNAEGLKIQTQSVATVLSGGIAFDTLDNAETGQPTLEHYDLAADRQSAMAPPDGEPMYCQLKFNQSLRGLEPNAPVEFRGINVGKVMAIHVEPTPDRKHYPVLVDIQVFPDRMRRNDVRRAKQRGEKPEEVIPFLGGMVSGGLRAQARSGNILTGQLFIAIDFFPNAAKASFDPHSRPLTLPTIEGGFDQIQDQMASIVGKLNKIPFDTIAGHLDENLTELHKTLKQVNRDILPETRSTLAQTRQTLGAVDGALDTDSPLQQNLNQTLQELQRSARSLRSLTDQLNAHPDALIKGRANDSEQENKQ